MVIEQGQLYDLNLQLVPDEQPKGDVVVDLKIDGRNGPIPKIIQPKDRERTVWLDARDRIDAIRTPEDKMLAVTALAEQIHGKLKAPQT